MNKRILGMIVTLALLFGCGATQVFATDAKVVASLSADKKTVSSSYAMFEASTMFGNVYSSSKYAIKYEDIGNNTGSGTGYTEANFTCAVASSYSTAITNLYNYHKIVLTGWNGLTAKKDCIGYGYIE